MSVWGVGVVSMFVCIRSLYPFKTSVAYPGFNERGSVGRGRDTEWGVCGKVPCGK